MKCPFEDGKVYKTREGREVQIIGLFYFPETSYPLIGRYLDNRTLARWSFDGHSIDEEIRHRTDLVQTKVCSCCKEEKPIEKFGKKDLLVCRHCRYIKSSSSPSVQRNWIQRMMFGITSKDY